MWFVPLHQTNKALRTFFESTSVVHTGYLELDEKWVNGAKK